MKKVFLALALTLIYATPSFAQANNVCANLANVRFFPISINTATTTRLVDNTGSANRYIVPCNLTLTIIGAAAPQTLAFTSGTGATCGTGTSNLTGNMSGPGSATDTAFWPWPMFPFGKIKTGDSLCVVTSQAVQISGILTFVFVGPT
jgi:hypothetical protein